MLLRTGTVRGPAVSVSCARAVDAFFIALETAAVGDKLALC